MSVDNAKSEKTDHSFPLDNSDLTRRSSKNRPASNSAVFDPFFGIKVASPRFTLDVFNTYCNTLMKFKLGALSSLGISANTIIMGVVVESSGLKRSSNGKDYAVWHLSDLKSDHKVKLLLFGDAALTHLDLKCGFVAAITNAEMVENNNNASSTILYKDPTLKVVKALQVLSLGQCPDYGTCTGLKRDGNPCTNYVNVSQSTICVYHLQTEAKKMRSSRGSLSAVSNERPKCFAAKSPKKRVSPRKKMPNRELLTVKRSSGPYKSDSAANLFTGSPMLVSKAPLGHKVMQRLMQEKEDRMSSFKPETPQHKPAMSMRDFIGQMSNSVKVNSPRKRKAPSEATTGKRPKYIEI